VILTQQTESQLVRNGLANTAGTRAQKLLHADSVDNCGGMGIAPRRVTATGFETSHIDCVLNSKAQSIEWPVPSGRQIESAYESVALRNGHRGGFHSSYCSRKLSYARCLFKERRFPTVGENQ
jgi:hypothetical protein